MCILPGGSWTDERVVAYKFDDMEKNTVYFLSLGPGGTDTVTLGTVRILQQCERVYCFASHGFSYAHEILKQLPVNTPVEVVEIPMSLDRNMVMQCYAEVASKVKQEVQSGMTVALVTEGDSSIYATTHYVKDMLDADGVSTCQQAGVPSFIAAASRAGLHLISQEQRLLVVPGRITVQEIENHIDNGNTLVIMKLSLATEQVHQIMASHPTYHYHFFSKVGTLQEYYSSNLAELSQMQYPYFSLMIIQG